MKFLKLTALCMIFLSFVSSPGRCGLTGSCDGEGTGEKSGELLFYNCLTKVEDSTRLWAGEDYGDIYNRFSNELIRAERLYGKSPVSAASQSGQLLIEIYEDFETVHEFMQAYLNDKALLMKVNIFMEPTYTVGRDRWPALLEMKFPGIISAIGEEGENGQYISGKKAVAYMLRKIRGKLKSYAEEYLPLLR